MGLLQHRCRLFAIPKSSQLLLSPVILLLLQLFASLQLMEADAGSTCSIEMSCSLSFDGFDRACIAAAMVVSSNRVRQVQALPYLSVAALCPAGCLSAAPRSAVRGSFPYHSSSSVCLSAVHAGVINGSTGGGVFVSRFYRQDWSNSSTQTIFPHGSWLGSLSNSVLSLNVSSDWFSVPSNDSEWSYTVRGRGDFISQRRRAPFPARAGHVHVATDYADVNNTGGYRPYTVHVVVGGYNATHYLNSVWLGLQERPAGGGRYRDLSWQQMPDAPFSPRADMLVRPVLMVPTYRGDRQPFILLMGGQTGHHCGLRELGECSNEVWRLDVVMANDGSGLSTRWSDGPLWRLPFSPRCDAGLSIVSTREGVWNITDHDYLRFYGGQLSYTDASCTSPPVTVNDVWGLNISSSGSLLPHLVFQRGPFSPRRLGQPAVFSFESSGLDRIDRIFGGIRHLNFSRSNDSSALRLTRSELYADVWDCQARGWSQLYLCSWTKDSGGRDVPLASLPVPAASPLLGHSLRYTNFLDIGGILPRDAIAQWTQALPNAPDGIEPDWSEAITNLSAVLGSLPNELLSMQDILDGRQQLPLTAIMGEDELNDPQGNYVLGSEWVQGWAGGFLPTYAAMATLHRQPLAFAVDRNGSSWSVPQPASSRNTTRPLFNFPLRRVHHRSLSLEVVIAYDASIGIVAGESVISGGLVAGLPTSEWIVTTPARCLPPTDPSFASVLGPVQVMSYFPDWAQRVTSTTMNAGSYPVLTPLAVNCPPRYHLQPPMVHREAVLRCAPTGMWLDSEAFTVRSCVKDRLNCTGLLTDLGGLYCDPVLPVLQGMQASYEFDGARRLLSGPDAVTLLGLPASGFPVSLTLFGSLFLSSELQVLVGGYTCEDARLRVMPGPREHERLCYNISFSNTVRQLECDDWSTAVGCQLPPLTGVNLPVTVRSGRLGALTAVDHDIGRIVATISTAPPVLKRLLARAQDCRQTINQQHLGQCTVTARFLLTVCLDAATVGQGAAMDVTLGDSRRPLDCTAFHGADVAVERCASCVVVPRLGAGLEVRVHNFSLGLVSAEDASLSFSSCDPGQRVDGDAALRGNATSLCVPCPPGTASEGAASAFECAVCRAGYYAATAGQAQCAPCPVGQFGASARASACDSCPLNSLLVDEAQTRCEACELNSYIVYSALNASGSSERRAGDCVPCPQSAFCDVDGNITAMAGAYLLVSQAAGTVDSVQCSGLACRDSSECSGTGTEDGSQRISSSQLRVVNCCGDGRWPAYLQDRLRYEAEPQLQLTDGHNVLCALCLPGYSVVNGRCISCPHLAWAPLTGLLLLALLVVYVVHRLPSDLTGAATVVVLSYFLQQSSLFLSSENLPQLLSLLQVSLLGDHLQQGAGSGAVGAISLCIVPLTDSGRITMALLSPLIALAMLAIIALMQLAAHSAIRSGLCGQTTTLRRLLRCLFRPPRAPHENRVAQRPSDLLLEAFSSGHYTAPSASEELSQPLMPVDDKLDAKMESLDRPHGLSYLPSASVAGSAGPGAALMYQRSCVRLVQLSYSSLSYLSLSFFYVQRVGEFGWRLVDYPSIGLQSAEYRALLPIMVLLLLLVVAGWPVLLLLFLAAQQRNGSVARLKEQQLLQAQGAVPFGPLLSAKDDVLQQLIGMFRTAFWWMPAFLLVRRLLLVALLVTDRSSSVWVWLTAANFSLLAVHLITEPYQRPRDNRVEAVTLLSLSCMTTLRAVWPPPARTAALSAALNSLLIGPLLPLLVLLAMDRYREFKQSAGSVRATVVALLEVW